MRILIFNLLLSLMIAAPLIYVPVAHGDKKFGSRARRSIHCASFVESADLQKAALAAFDVRQVRKENLTRLSGHVFLASNVNGHSYVIRLPGELDDTLREPFAASFVNHFSHLKTPEVWPVPKEERRVLLEAISALSSRSLSDLRDQRLVHGNGDLSDRLQITLSLFYPMKRGAQVLSERGLNQPILDLLNTTLQQLSHLDASSTSFVHFQMERLWPEEREKSLQLIHTLKTIFPSTEDVPVKQYLSHLVDNLSQLPVQAIANFYSEKREQIPQAVHEQLSDYWAAYTILGISDFHANNWLIEGEQVLAIDLAQPREERFSEDRPLSLSYQQHPYGKSPVDETMRQRLIGNISSEFVEDLKALKPEDIQNMAEESGYDLKEAELEQIMDRIEYLIGAI